MCQRACKLCNGNDCPRRLTLTSNIHCQDYNRRFKNVHCLDTHKSKGISSLHTIFLRLIYPGETCSSCVTPGNCYLYSYTQLCSMLSTKLRMFLSVSIEIKKVWIWIWIWIYPCPLPLPSLLPFPLPTSPSPPPQLPGILCSCHPPP